VVVVEAVEVEEEEEDSVVGEAEVEVEAEEEVEEANRQQLRQPLILPETVSKEYHPPFFKEIPRCLIHSNKSGNYIEPPMLTTMT
jgi:hypothetical protein